MAAHIFLVKHDKFEVCINKGVYGCVEPGREANTSEVVSSLMGMKPGDRVFFYVTNAGVYGLWRVIDWPFYDATPIWKDPDNPKQKYPFRFTFEPIVRSFPRPIGLVDLMDLKDKGHLWTFDLGTKTRKNQNIITTAEAGELLRLLLRNNPIYQAAQPIKDPYAPPQKTQLLIPFGSAMKGKSFQYEAWLNAWFMSALTKGKLKRLFGDYSDIVNLVPTSFNKVLDIFLTHVSMIDGVEILHKYTCIELKADRANEDDLVQTLRYENWLTRKLADGDPEMVQSVLVARSFSDKVLDYVLARKRIEERTIRMFEYSVEAKSEDVTLNEVDGRG